jgi:hypothetical protein
MIVTLFIALNIFNQSGKILLDSGVVLLVFGENYKNILLEANGLNGHFIKSQRIRKFGLYLERKILSKFHCNGFGAYRDWLFLSFNSCF